MLRYFTFLLFIFFAHVSLSQDLTATMTMPESVEPGEKFIVEVTINKGSINSYIKFIQKLPPGFRAYEKDVSGGNFSFTDSIVKIVWLFPPAKNEFTFTYAIKAPKEISSIEKIGGKIYYFFNTNRESFSFNKKDVIIGSPDIKSLPADDSVVRDTVYIDRVITSPVSTSTSSSSDTLVVTSIDSAPVVISDTPNENVTTNNENSTEVIKEDEAVKVVTTESAEPIKESDPVQVNSASVTTEPESATPEKVVATPPASQEPTSSGQQESSTSTTTQPQSGDLIYGIQVGAYKEDVPVGIANKFFEVSAKGFKNLKKNNGVTTFIVGEFNTYDEGVKLKYDMINKGFEGAFIISFSKSGQSQAPVKSTVNNTEKSPSSQSNIPVESSSSSTKTSIELNGTSANNIQSLRTIPSDNEPAAEVKNTVAETETESTETKAEVVSSAPDSIEVASESKSPAQIEDVPFDANTTKLAKTYRIQVGAYKDALPPDIAEKFKTVGAIGVKNLKGYNGITYYIVGDFSNRENAVGHKNALIEKGFEGAFIIIYYKH